MSKIIKKQLTDVGFKYDKDADDFFALRLKENGNNHSFYLTKQEAKALARFINKEIK